MATSDFHNAAEKMPNPCRKIIHVNLRWRAVSRCAVFRRLFAFIRERILPRSGRNTNIRYRRLSPRRSFSSPSTESVGRRQDYTMTTTSCSGYESDSDLVSLKIGALGDRRIGKTRFLVKYVGDEQEKISLQMKGLNLMDKTMYIQGARIAFRIWDVGGDNTSSHQVPIACKDAVAILFMFDLTSRSTLNSILEWYSEARKWNQDSEPFWLYVNSDRLILKCLFNGGV